MGILVTIMVTCYLYQNSSVMAVLAKKSGCMAILIEKVTDHHDQHGHYMAMLMETAIFSSWSKHRFHGHL
jgi:hypothetical protein